MSIRLLVDSSADLSQELVDQFNFTVVPLSVHFGQEEFLDGQDITPKAFYERLVTSEDHPTTSQVPPERFVEYLNPILEKGEEAIIITIGSEASGTCQSAHIAVNALETDQVSIIDSNSLSMGVAYIAIMAAKYVEAGLDRGTIVEKLKPLTDNQVEHLFCVDTLEFLKKGGRIKASKAAVAEILNIKPILNVNNAITQTIHKVRGRKKIIPYYLKKLAKDLDQESDMILVAHAQDEAFAKELVDSLRQELGWNKTIYISEIGATIGTHAGPGVLACFYKKIG